MKKFLKKCLIIFMIVIVLLPSLFTGMANAEDISINLTVERAGNYIANFAINFYENWSSTDSNDGSGEVKTQYDVSNVEGINFTESSEKYILGNKSFINFVYKNSLKLEDSNLPLINGINIRSLSDVGEKILDEEIIDIYKLMNSGKILPGDILISTDGHEKEEYLLYVGGTKVIYATPTYNSNGILDEQYGALKYDYLQYYLKDIKDALVEEYKQEGQLYDEVEIPVQYGIKQVYRIGGNLVDAEGVFTTINENNANLIYNGKGYYNPDVKYYGIPQKMAYNGVVSENIFEWLIGTIWQIVRFIINLILYAFRLIITGWVNIVESIIQTVVLSVGGSTETNGTAIDKATGLSAITAVGDRVTIESIFFNKVPILDVNFFDYENAGKYSLLITDASGNLVPDEGNAIYVLRQNLAIIYYLLRNISIVIMLLILIYLGIRLAITTIGEKKAQYKGMLLSWLTSFIIVIFIHLFMYVVFTINDSIINICEKATISAGTEALGGLAEGSLYEAVRTKAYSFNFTEGTIGLIFYIVMVYLLVRYLFVYFRRVISVYVLALSGSVMGIKYAIDKIGGKKTNSFGKWLKEFSFNVILQSVHAIVYTILMAVALRIAETSLSGLLFSFVILNVMISSDKVFMKIFGIDKASSLRDINELSSPIEMYYRFLPFYNIGKRFVLFGKGLIVNKDGVWFAPLKYAETGKDNIKDAQKAVLQKKFTKIGEKYRKKEDKYNKFIERRKDSKIFALPIKVLNTKKNSFTFKQKAALSGYVSVDTNKASMKELKGYKQLKKQMYTRSVLTSLGLGYGMFQGAMSVGQMAESPKLGILSTFKVNATINKYKSKGKYRGSVDRLQKLQIEAVEKSLEKSKNLYYSFYSEYQDKDATFKRANKAKLDALRNDVAYKQRAYELVQEGRYGRRPKAFEFGISNIERQYQNLQAADAKKIKDAEKRLEYYNKLAHEEAKLNKAMEDLKQEVEQYAIANGLDVDATLEEMRRNVTAILKGSKNARIPSATVKSAIGKVVNQANQTEKVRKENVEQIVEQIERKCKSHNNKGPNYEIKVEDKCKIEESIINEISAEALVARAELAMEEYIGVDSKKIKKEILKELQSKMAPITQELASLRRSIKDGVVSASSVQSRMQDLITQRNAVTLSETEIIQIVKNNSKKHDRNVINNNELEIENKLKYNNIIEQALSKKDTLKVITTAVGDGELLQPDSVLNIQSEAIRNGTPQIADCYKTIASTVMKIDGLNEQSKVNTKQTLVKRGKVISNARKKNGGE